MIYIIGRGTLGSSLAEYFADRGIDMVTIGRKDNWPEFREEDTIINTAVSGFYGGEGNVVQTVKDNFVLPVSLYENSNGANMISFGSWFEEVAPFRNYSRSKGLATSFLEGKAHVCMLSTVWGSRHDPSTKFMPTFLEACSKDKKYIITHPSRRRDFIHIDQFCPAIEALAKHRKYAKRYFSTGVLRSFSTVYGELCAVAGRQFPKVRFVNDMSTDYDWHVPEPFFEDTFREDLEREWRLLNG